MSMKRNSMHRVTTRSVVSLDGVLRTNADALLRVQVFDKAGASILSEANMTYVSPGRWQLDIAASVFTAVTAPWEVVVREYDLAGTTLRNTERFVEPDAWYLSEQGG